MLTLVLCKVMTEPHYVRFEEEEPVPTPLGWHMTVKINQVAATPGGTRSGCCVQSPTATEYKQVGRRTWPNETDDQRELRLGVKRNVKKRAMDKFDPEKMAKKQER